MLMFTYVHSHTTDTWPAVPLCLVFVVSATGLEDGLVNTATTSNDTFTHRREPIRLCTNNIALFRLHPTLRVLTDYSSVGGGDDFLGA